MLPSLREKSQWSEAETNGEHSFQANRSRHTAHVLANNGETLQSGNVAVVVYYPVDVKSMVSLLVLRPLYDSLQSLKHLWA